MVLIQVNIGALKTSGQAGSERGPLGREPRVSYLSCLWRGACEGRVQRCL